MDVSQLLFILVCTAAVFAMQAGFMLFITGLTRAHHAISIFLKSLALCATGILVFFTLGAFLAFGPAWNGLVGLPHSGLSQVVGNTHNLSHLLFLAAVSLLLPAIPLGAMAGRVRFSAYLIYSFIASLAITPILMKWVWGGLLFPEGKGWLESLGFVDYGGAGVIHMCAGVIGLVGSALAGPRLGKFGPDRRPRAMPGHHLVLSAFGVFMLALAWPFLLGGFGSLDASSILPMTRNAMLAGSAGLFGALIPAWIFTRKPDGPFAMGGLLAGLVAISGGASSFSPGVAAGLGALAGAVSVGGVYLFEHVFHLDDPAGVLSIHGLGGLLGILANGLFMPGWGVWAGGNLHGLLIQVLGALALMGWTLLVSVVLFLLLKYTLGLRVRPSQELRGLDLSEHGMEAYSGFQIFNNL